MARPGLPPSAIVRAGTIPVIPPNQLFGADLFKWHRASDTALVKNGNAVAGWPDAQDNGAFQQPDAECQPVYGATSFNGRPGITFDGTRSSMRATFSALANNSVCYIWCVAKLLSIGFEDGPLFCLCPDPAGGFAASQYMSIRTTAMSETGTPGKVELDSIAGGAGFHTPGPHVDFDNGHVFSGGIVGPDVPGGGTPAMSRFRVDGVDYGGNGTGLISSTHPIINLSLGAQEAGGAFGHATHAEIVMITRLPTASELAIIDAYFKSANGLGF